MTARPTDNEELSKKSADYKEGLLKHKILQAQLLADRDYERVGCSEHIYNEKTQHEEYMAYAWRMHDHLRKESQSFYQELNQSADY